MIKKEKPEPDEYSADNVSYTHGDDIPRVKGSAKIHWYVGIPGSGKTFLAKMHALEDSTINGYPILVLNSAETADFGEFPVAKSVAEVIAMVWRDGKHCQFKPETVDDVDRIVKASLHPGRVNLLIDETHFWIKARSVTSDSPLVRLCRAYRHGDTSVYFTTQHFSGDIPSEMVSCAPEMFIFRSTAPAVLKRLEEWHGLDARKVRSLPARQFFLCHEGFSPS